MPHPGLYLRLCHTQLTGLPLAPYLWLSSPRPGTSSSQLWITVWLCLGISEPSTSSSHLTLLYSSCWVVPGRTQVVADPDLHHQGNIRVCTPSGQLQTTSEHHHPAPAQLTFIEGGSWWSVVNSKSLKLTSLAKSLPLTCQQQTRLNYKRKVYSAHMEGVPLAPSLGDRGSCAIGAYRPCFQDSES